MIRRGAKHSPHPACPPLPVRLIASLRKTWRCSSTGREARRSHRDKISKSPAAVLARGASSYWRRLGSRISQPCVCLGTTSTEVWRCRNGCPRRPHRHYGLRQGPRRLRLHSTPALKPRSVSEAERYQSRYTDDINAGVPSRCISRQQRDRPRHGNRRRAFDPPPRCRLSKT